VDKPLYLSSSPHIHSGDTTAGIMRMVIYALLPATLLSIYFFGLPALRTLLICILGCIACEALGCWMMQRAQTIRDGSAALTGLLLALNLPPSSPWWMALFGAAIAIWIGKLVYGGLGYNPFNPALVARVILLISFPVQMTTWTTPAPPGSGLDAVTGATPLGEMKSAVMLTGQLPDLATSGFDLYFYGLMAGSLGEVSALALLLGGIFLIVRKVITWHIPVSYLASVVVCGGFFWLVDPGRYPSPLFHLLTGGLILGAFFMATDMVTSPITARGMLVFGTGCGLLTVLIRLFGGYPEGVSFAILLMNATTPLIDRYTQAKIYGQNAAGASGGKQ
jgi:electron transport complex protein RnfD